MWFSLCDKLEIVGRYGRSVAVIWSQVIWGQGWGPGRGMNLNNGSPQTLVIGVRLCNSKTQLCGLPSHKRKLRHENMAKKYLVQPYFAETRQSILDLNSLAQESLKIWWSWTWKGQTEQRKYSPSEPKKWHWIVTSGKVSRSMLLEFTIFAMYQRQNPKWKTRISLFSFKLWKWFTSASNRKFSE